MIIESPDDVEVELLEPPPDMGGEADPGRPPRAVRRRTPASAPITLERVPAGPTTVAQVFGMDPGAVAVRVNGEPALVEPDGRWAVRLAVGPDRRLEVEITDADGRTTTRSQTLDGAER